MSMRGLAAVALLLLCPLVSAVEESCAKGKCIQEDDYTSLMQMQEVVNIRHQLEASSMRYSSYVEDYRTEPLEEPLDLGPIYSGNDTVTTGKDFTCARSPDYIACWGDNSEGQLGLQGAAAGSATINRAPATVDFINAPNSRVVAGANHMCLIVRLGNDAGKVKCWGANNKGQLGYESIQNVTSPPDLFVNLGTGFTAFDLALGDEHTCAILNHSTAASNSQIKCWGRGDYGQLGTQNTETLGDDTNEMGDQLQMLSLGNQLTAQKIVAGSHHTCAHLNNNQVKCWGLNGNGQLGQGQFTDQNRGFAQNQMGQSLPYSGLGSNATTGASYEAKAVFAGGNHTCVILNNNRSKCWGRNDMGQCGYGNTASLPNIGVASGQMGTELPVLDLGMKYLGGSRRRRRRSTVAYDVKTMALGGAHTCAVLGDSPGRPDRVKCWGLNDKGQLGHGDVATLGDAPGEMGNPLGPVSLGVDRYAVELSCGDKHTCAILNNNALKCWGSNSMGQLGDGKTPVYGNVGDRPDQMSDNMGEIDTPTSSTAPPASTDAPSTTQ